MKAFGWCIVFVNFACAFSNLYFGNYPLAFFNTVIGGWLLYLVLTDVA